MTYFEHDLVADVGGGYANIHQKQVYDAIAADLTAVGNWTLVDTVDAVVTTNTFRKFVWKCAVAGNGVSADYYVIFECQFVTATGVWSSSTTASTPLISLAEAYNTGTKTASKMATVQTATAVTLGSDLTHPATWVLTAARPSSNPNSILYQALNVSGSYSSARLCVTATAAMFATFFGNGSSTGEMYCGVFDSVMNATDDPMPIFLGGGGSTLGNSSGTASSVQQGATTRHPKLTPSGSYSYVFGHSFGAMHASAATSMGGGTYAQAAGVSQGGTAGDPASLSWGMFIGGVLASRICLTTSGSGMSGSTRGGFRGYLRNMAGVYATSHSIGDVFTIDAKAYAGKGSASTTATALIDKTA